MGPEPRQKLGLRARLKGRLRSRSREERPALASGNPAPITPPIAEPAVDDIATAPEWQELSLEEERTKMWKEAYRQVEKDDPDLVASYEILLVEVSSRPPSKDEEPPVPNDSGTIPLEIGLGSASRKLTLQEVS
jgi:hypothetical protein